MLGLIRAVEKFDWRRGCKFSTFAYRTLRGQSRRPLELFNRVLSCRSTST
jgi:DNA-directed RNA polymerase specialized sigma subunit